MEDFLEESATTEELSPTQPLDASDENGLVKIPFVPRTDSAWGYLETQSQYLSSAEIRKDTFIFGRSFSADYVVHRSVRVPDRFYNLVSRHHFTVELKKDSDDIHSRTIILQDHSLTGTYVNGELVGKDRRRPLVPNDIIAVVQSELPAFK